MTEAFKRFEERYGLDFQLVVGRNGVVMNSKFLVKFLENNEERFEQLKAKFLADQETKKEESKHDQKTKE